MFLDFESFKTYLVDFSLTYIIGEKQLLAIFDYFAIMCV